MNLNIASRALCGMSPLLAHDEMNVYCVRNWLGLGCQGWQMFGKGYYDPYLDSERRAHYRVKTQSHCSLPPSSLRNVREQGGNKSLCFIFPRTRGNKNSGVIPVNFG